ncbi:hypothetical protein BC833DRAFT_651127 [Globomyces pollinis-pini]|nr:hypothetical protein BC833DRAFT_651127 [Globomyces pollinis-pini]
MSTFPFLTLILTLVWAQNPTIQNDPKTTLIVAENVMASNNSEGMLIILFIVSAVFFSVLITGIIRFLAIQYATDRRTNLKGHEFNDILSANYSFSNENSRNFNLRSLSFPPERPSSKANSYPTNHSDVTEMIYQTLPVVTVLRLKNHQEKMRTASVQYSDVSLPIPQPENSSIGRSIKIPTPDLDAFHSPNSIVYGYANVGTQESSRLTSEKAFDIHLKTSPTPEMVDVTVQSPSTKSENPTTSVKELDNSSSVTGIKSINSNHQQKTATLDGKSEVTMDLPDENCAISPHDSVSQVSSVANSQVRLNNMQNHNTGTNTRNLIVMDTTQPDNVIPLVQTPDLDSSNLNVYYPEPSNERENSLIGQPSLQSNEFNVNEGRSEYGVVENIAPKLPAINLDDFRVHSKIMDSPLMNSVIASSFKYPKSNSSMSPPMNPAPTTVVNQNDYRLPNQRDSLVPNQVNSVDQSNRIPRTRSAENKRPSQTYQVPPTQYYQKEPNPVAEVNQNGMENNNYMDEEDSPYAYRPAANARNNQPYVRVHRNEQVNYNANLAGEYNTPQQNSMPPLQNQQGYYENGNFANNSRQPGFTTSIGTFNSFNARPTSGVNRFTGMLERGNKSNLVILKMPNRQNTPKE